MKNTFVKIIDTEKINNYPESMSLKINFLLSVRLCLKKTHVLNFNKSVSSQLQEKVEKLAKLTPRNVNKKVNHQKENNKTLQEQVDEANCKVDFLEKENEELNKSLDKALRMTLKLKKSVSYLKIKNRKINEDNNSESYIQSLKDQILSLENKKCELEEVFTTKKLSYFKNRYCDKIRMVYEDILWMGLCTHNVEKVIKIVLEKLAGIECD